MDRRGPHVLQGLEPHRHQGRRHHRVAVDSLLKRVFNAAHLPEAQLVVDQLAGAGIRARLFNTHASSIAGELPIESSLPQVWVEDDEQAPRAKELISKFLQVRPPGPPVTCPRCAEDNPSSFELCWSCGAPLPA